MWLSQWHLQFWHCKIAPWAPLHTSFASILWHILVYLLHTKFNVVQALTAKLYTVKIIMDMNDSKCECKCEDECETEDLYSPSSCACISPAITPQPEHLSKKSPGLPYVQATGLEWVGRKLDHQLHSINGGWRSHEHPLMWRMWIPSWPDGFGWGQGLRSRHSCWRRWWVCHVLLVCVIFLP
jgi:hypothetical protein